MQDPRVDNRPVVFLNGAERAIPKPSTPPGPSYRLAVETAGMMPSRYGDARADRSSGGGLMRLEPPRVPLPIGEALRAKGR